MAISGSAMAQSYNIEFGAASSTPSSAYGAAGLPGTWNTLGVPTVGVHHPLVNLQGVNEGVTLKNIGGTQLLVTNDPATTGDDERLMDDMLIGLNNPVDVCIWIHNLPNGPYEVLIYAMTPNNPTLKSRVRVDFANEPPQFVGGAWSGAHELLTTYSRHTVEVFDGILGLHSGLFNGFIQSGINGIQIRPLVPGDLDGNGAVDGADLGVMLGAWGDCPATGACLADLDGNGTVDGADLGVLLGAFAGTGG